MHFLLLTCPGCGSAFRMRVEENANAVKCRRCGKMIPLPKAADDEDSEEIIEDVELEEIIEEPAAPPVLGSRTFKLSKSSESSEAPPRGPDQPAGDAKKIVAVAKPSAPAGDETPHDPVSVEVVPEPVAETAEQAHEPVSIEVLAEPAEKGDFEISEEVHDPVFVEVVPDSSSTAVAPSVEKMSTAAPALPVTTLAQVASTVDTLATAPPPPRLAAESVEPLPVAAGHWPVVEELIPPIPKHPPPPAGKKP